MVGLARLDVKGMGLVTEVSEDARSDICHALTAGDEGRWHARGYEDALKEEPSDYDVIVATVNAKHGWRGGGVRR